VAGFQMALTRPPGGLAIRTHGTLYRPAQLEPHVALDRYWKSVPAPYLPIPPVENFFWSDWEHLRLSTKLQNGQIAAVVVQRNDPGLAAFFDKRRSGF